MSKKIDIESMTKDQLRAACKAEGIKYGSLSNLQMREALNALKAIENPPATDPTVTTPAADPIPAETPAESQKQEKPAQAAKNQRNGITMPKAGSICASIWEACDALKAEGKETSFEALKEKLPKVNDATIRTQRQRHKTYHG
jgi:hypothetical protein